MLWSHLVRQDSRLTGFRKTVIFDAARIKLAMIDGHSITDQPRQARLNPEDQFVRLLLCTQELLLAHMCWNMLLILYRIKQFLYELLIFVGDQVRLCKNVLQANRTFNKMTACGLFYVDAALPISLMALLTSYIIVLFQFAFLWNYDGGNTITNIRDV